MSQHDLARHNAIEMLCHKFNYLVELTAEDRIALQALPFKLRSYAKGADLIRAGDPPTFVHILLEGILARYKMLSGGDRQILGLQLVGDIIGLDSLYLIQTSCSASALVASSVAVIPVGALTDLVHSRPALAAAVCHEVAVAASMMQERLLCMAQLASTQLAHLLCELAVRFGAVRPDGTAAFVFPVTQQVVSEILGITPVHVNRSLQTMREDGLVEWKGGIVTIPDWDQLVHVGQFEATYLHQPGIATSVMTRGTPRREILLLRRIADHTDHTE